MHTLRGVQSLGTVVARTLLLSRFMGTATKAFHVANHFPRLHWITSHVRPHRPFLSMDMSASAQTPALSTVDVDKCRKDMVDADGTVVFNSAGDSPMPRAVLERVTRHLEMEATLGGYEAAARCSDELEEVYNNAARLINANPEEIALQESASMAWARAFYALAQGLKPGDRLLTSLVEYAANYVAMIQVCKRTGAVLEVIPSDETGEIDLKALESMLTAGGVKAVAITHVPTNGGVVNPAEEVGEICRRFGTLYVLDACQSVGQLQVDVQEIGCHVLCATGRKYLRAPRGTGFLYISREAMDVIGEPPMIDHYAAPCVSKEKYALRKDARRFEFWESNVAGRLGLGVALRYALSIGMKPIEARIAHLAALLRDHLKKEGRVSVMDLGRKERQCGIVTFTVQGVGADIVKQGLRAEGVYVSMSGPSSTPLDAEDRALPDVVRASVHYFNTEQELERFMDVLRMVIASNT